MEKNMQHGMETGLIWGKIIIGIATSRPGSLEQGFAVRCAIHMRAKGC